MQERVGVNVIVMLKSTILPLGAFVCLALPAICIVGRTIRLSTSHIERTVGIVLAALVAGSALAEVWIVSDEKKFAALVSANAKPYSRSRPWPFDDASLVFVPNRGVHATD